VVTTILSLTSQARLACQNHLPGFTQQRKKVVAVGAAEVEAGE